MSKDKKRVSVQNISPSVHQPEGSMSEWRSLLKYSWLWFATSALLLLGGAIYAVYAYARIADPIVGHWNLAMEPDRYIEKSLIRVLAIPAAALLIVLILSAISSIVRITVISVRPKRGAGQPVPEPAKKPISEETPDPSELARRQKVLLFEYIRHAIGMFALLTSLMFSAVLLRTMNPHAIPALGMGVVIYGSALMMIFIPIVLGLTTGINGHKLNPMKAHFAPGGYAIGFVLIVTALFAYLVTIYQIG